MSTIEERLDQLIDEQHGAAIADMMLTQEARNRYIRRRNALRASIAADFGDLVAIAEMMESLESDNGGRTFPTKEMCQAARAVLARVKGEGS